MPVGHTCDEQPETYPARRSRQCGECGHTLEALAGTFAVHRDVVIEPPRAVEAELLAESHAIDDLVEGHPLLGDVDPETHTAEASRPDGQPRKLAQPPKLAAGWSIDRGVAVDRDRATRPGVIWVWTWHPICCTMSDVPQSGRVLAAPGESLWGGK